MEHLPKGSFFSSSLNKADKQSFLQAYREYRSTFPKQPSRPLTLPEKLNPSEWIIYRMNRWFELATYREFDRESDEGLLYDHKELIQIYQQSINLFRKTHANLDMIWSHGHFKPQEIFIVDEKDLYYLTDFAHTQLLPKGHELAFIIWADWMMIQANWNAAYSEWKTGIIKWIDTMDNERKIQNISDELMHAALLERTIGTLLADIGASDKPKEELKKGARLHLQLARELIDQTLF